MNHPTKIPTFRIDENEDPLHSQSVPLKINGLGEFESSFSLSKEEIFFLLKNLTRQDPGVYFSQRLTNSSLGNNSDSMVSHVSSANLNSFEESDPKNKLPIDVYDEPLVVMSIEPPVKTSGVVSNPLWKIICQYGWVDSFSLESLALDDWDRFHGKTTNGIPFVLSSAAQETFFDLLDSFDDDSITFGGQSFPTPYWYSLRTDISQNVFWSEVYKNNPHPNWELEGPHPAFVQVLPQLKLNKQRVLVLGCGTGHDAAFFAQKGHLVTAVDFSPLAIERAKALHPNVKNIEWLCADAFDLPPEHWGQYDLLVEHTCFCAISPERRPDLVKAWRRYLTEHGHVLGLFFAMNKFFGPPYGASEWEVHKRLDPFFDFRYWMRWPHSPEWRKGIELLVYAEVARRFP